MKDIIRVALIQPKPYPSYEDPRNIGHALQLMEKCRGEDLDVICLPEYFPLLGEKEIGGAARKYAAYVIAGMVEEEGGRRYNTATLFNRTGRMVGRQRKVNIGAVEREKLGISAGDGTFRAFSTDFGKIGFPVGIDLWGQPEAARQLTEQGADVIFNPSVFSALRGHWKTGSLVRAFDNFVPVIGCNTADYNALLGEKRVHHYGGGSFIAHPPKLLDKDDFQRWARSLDSIESWIQMELDELEQVYMSEVNLSTPRRMRSEFFSRFGFLRR
ncbi:MAG: carbon-nitrogen hydrolase family protein [Desulfobacteraceae bacterium]|nr:carbon-nitrogen hydrolase family protein [Desulfobacteraceae bacterium]